MQEALSRLTKGRTVLVIAHRLSTVVNADKICVLSQGKASASFLCLNNQWIASPFSRLLSSLEMGR